MSKKVKRLFHQFKPISYKINLDISQDKMSFKGSVVIKGEKTGRPTKRITLHQKGLVINVVSVVFTDRKSNSKNINIVRTLAHNKLNEFRIHSDNQLFPGLYTIKLTFRGTITPIMDGIYPSFFKDNKTEKKLISTQFESHHAREVFPCIDEPEAKATFDFTLTNSKDEICLSNTPPKSTSTKEGRQTTEFETTPIMSTYLLAFVVGELEYKEKISKHGVKIRTYATKNQIQYSQFALDVAAKCIDFYEDYFNIKYPLAKCDFVALPDFASGAMENWGLITFREQTLLFDEKTTSLSTKQYVALVIAHELTHQWFGNLVTMRWWTDLWLNEGFASWMEYLAIDKLFPEWELWTQFMSNEQQHALNLDSLEHTHPIEVIVNHPDEIRSIFDIISYNKGASIIHMLSEYLGETDFREGLRYYLKTHSYSNTDTDDLWEALEKSSKKPVKEFMGAWTSQAGYPLLTVNHSNDHITISQKRLVTNPISKARESKSIWPIPLLTKGVEKDIIYKTVNNVPLTTKDIPVKINIGQTGFYRVEYSKIFQEIQKKAIMDGQLPAVDRMGLLSDSLASVKAGYTPIDYFLNLLKNYQSENNLSVWEVIASAIGSIRGVLSKSDLDDTLRQKMNPFVIKLTAKQYGALGWDKITGENHLNTLLRPVILNLNAISDNPNALKIIHQLFNSLAAGQNNIHPDIRSIVYTTIARKGNKAEFEQLLNMYMKSTSSDEKLSLTVALTNFKDPALHKKVYSFMKTDNVRFQDLSYWIAYSLSNRYSRESSWSWLKQNWSWLKHNIGTDLGFSRMPIYVARNFSMPEQLQQYQDFFEKQLEPALIRSYNQGTEIIQTNAQWRKRDSQKAINWFS